MTRVAFWYIFFTYLVSYSACIKVSAEPICSFPPGSIACKVWNHTNMDCSCRDLDCIPHLRHKASLELLDFSNNNLTVLQGSAFSDFVKLHILNLSSNHISALNGSFIGLHLLQTLDLTSNSLLHLPDNVFSRLPNLLSLYLSNLTNLNVISVSDMTFNRLGKLKILDLSWNLLGMYGSPFQHLHSLQTLSLNDNERLRVTHTTFAGLSYTLQVLYILISRGVTRGGRGGRVAHPWKIWGKILEGRGK